MIRAVLARPGAGVAVTVAVVALTAAASYIHLTLGGLLFLLNGLGYVGLIGLFVLGFLEPHPLFARFAWFPRLALAGYAALTIAAYLVIGPYFALGWLTKAIEVGIIGLLAIDVIRVYGSPEGFVRTALGSIFGSRTAKADVVEADVSDASQATA